MDSHERAPAPIHRTISYALRIAREREESETLLGEEENQLVDPSGCVIAPHSVTFNPHADLPVYKNIHRIRRLIVASIDDPYTMEQLMSPRINISIVRPLTIRLYNPDDVSIVYCLLVNKSRFQHDQIIQAHHQTVNHTRAMLCEILAARVLRRFNEDNPTRPGLLLLANILVAGFEPFQNCPDGVLKDSRQLLHRPVPGSPPPPAKTTNALEVAIMSESKMFLSSTACHRVTESLYHGRIIYTPNSLIDFIPDHYKRKSISLYDPRKAPILNHYRLIVPRTRAILEFLHFIVLLGLYAATMISREQSSVTWWEAAFMVYAAGWVLDEIASMFEHGWLVHTQNLWSFLDISLVGIYGMYALLRAHGWASGDPEVGIQALDVLACAAPIMMSRVAFEIMPENLLFICLRAMMRDFLVLTGVAIWCFGGFLLAMSWLSRWRSADAEPVPPLTISTWLLEIWFGLDGTGLEQSPNFHLIIGPILMISFAFIGNTLFLTILVALLTNTFSKIANNATAEIQFRRAVLTFEGVKSDAIFAYRPPFNILAVLILVPLRYFTSPRWFHKIHVFAARLLNAPLLLAIAVYERNYLWRTRVRGSHAGAIKREGRPGSKLFHLSGFSAHRDLQDVFDIEPPQEMVDEIEEEDIIDEDVLDVGYSTRNNRLAVPSNDEVRRRRFSSVVPNY